MELSILVAFKAHLGTLCFTATHVDHFSKATVCSYQHCLPCAVTYLRQLFSVKGIPMYTVLKISGNR